MNPVEIYYKLSLDALLTILLWAFVVKIPALVGLLTSWFLAHTINWIINGQPVAMCRHLDWGKNDPLYFIEYIERLERRLQSRHYLAAAAAFGSLSKGNYKKTSDLDIRFVMRNGFFNRMRAAHFCFMERLRAAFFRFPLDLYAFEFEEIKHKMNKDEVPVIFYDPHGVLFKTYSHTVPFISFKDNFRRNILRAL